MRLTLLLMHIITAKYLVSSPDLAHCPPPDRPEYAFIGRSNVGKSTLINMLTNNLKLAKTSNSPGKTKLINHFEISSNEEGHKIPEQWYLTDLPGYGFAKVSISQRRQWEQMIENYLRKRENLINVFVLIDSRHSPQKLDLDFINQLGKWDVPFTLLFTKADKETQLVVSRNVKQFMAKMRETWQFLPQQIITSSIKKMGRDKVLTVISEFNQVYRDEMQKTD